MAYNTWFPSMMSQVQVSTGFPYNKLAWLLNKCMALWRAVYSIELLQLKDALELFVKRREFLPGSMFLYRQDMTLNPTVHMISEMRK